MQKYKTLIVSFLILLLASLLISCSDTSNNLDEFISFESTDITKVEATDYSTVTGLWSTIYSSESNDDDNELFEDFHVSIYNHHYTETVDNSEGCAQSNFLKIIITANNDTYEFRRLCISDGSNKDLVTVLTINEEITIYTDSDLITDLENLLNLYPNRNE